MLVSMTGYGEGRFQSPELEVRAELRSINNRHFKLMVRVPEGMGALEPLLESHLRGKLRRGTVQLNVRIRRCDTADDYQLNIPVLKGYCQQLVSLGEQPRLSELLLLPGVVDTAAGEGPDVETIWPGVQQAVDDAFQQLDTMRRREGDSMRRDLDENLERIATELGAVQQRAPAVVQAYQTRLNERMAQLLAEHDVTLQPGDVLREVGIFADRADISEEIVRLRSHLDQARTMLGAPDSVGRRMDFLIQEMFRETNTMGSKANDAEIARRVVEIKTVIERMREMIQNVE